MSERYLSESKNYEGYLIEVSLPPSFANEISKVLENETIDIDSRLGEKNHYIKLSERETLNLLDGLNLDPLKPELPGLLLLDKPLREVAEGEKEVLIKLGALEKVNDVSVIIDEICGLMKTDEFMRELTSDQRRKKLKKAFEEYPEVVVSLVSPILPG